MSRIEIVKGLSNNAYHNGYKEYISSTTLKKYIESNMQFKHEVSLPKVDKPHFAFGSFWHDLISSKHPKGESIEENYAIVDYPDYMLNKGKPYGPTSQAYIEGFNRMRAAHDGKAIIFPEQYEQAKAMVDGIFTPIWKHPSEKAFKALFEKGEPEVSYFINDFVPDVNIKFRPDLDGSNYFLDYKTTSESISNFTKTILNFGYDISAGMYHEGKQESNRELYGEDIETKMYWLVQCTNPPYDWAIFSAERIMPIGIQKFYTLLERHNYSKSTGQYPGIAHFANAKHGIFTPEYSHWQTKLNNLI